MNGGLAIFVSNLAGVSAWPKEVRIITAVKLSSCMQDLKAQAETMSWLMWQMGGLGPMQGQASHFFRFAKEQIPYAINRYQNELERLYQVMDTALEGKEWLANDEYSIADMASFPWVFASPIAGTFSVQQSRYCTLGVYL